jgi:undecaprenyl-diphosphatase
MMVYATLALTLVDDPRRRMFWLLAAFALAFLIGLSRPMLGVHWPSDVIAGWSFGLLWAMLLVWLSRNPPSWAVRR